MIKKRQTTQGARYDVRLRSPDGRVYNRTFRTKREAERYEATERADRARGAWLDPRHAETTFADAAKTWLDSNPAKRDGAWARDESVIRLPLTPALEGAPSDRLPRPTCKGSSMGGWPPAGHPAPCAASTGPFAPS